MFNITNLVDTARKSVPNIEIKMLLKDELVMRFEVCSKTDKGMLGICTEVSWFDAIMDSKLIEADLTKCVKAVQDKAISEGAKYA